ncbi:MAG: hypothetical protein AAGF02_03080 [Actinomycetota bacterium]
MVAERSSTPAESVDPTDLERAELPTVFRGADQQVVQRLLRLAAGEIRRLRAELDEVRAAATAPPEPEAGDLDEAELTARLGEEAAMVLTAAREAAAQVRTRAEEKIGRLLREAQDEAADTRERAERDRATALDEARVEAEAIVSGAERIQHEAVGRVEAELETARLRSQDLVAEAQTRRTEILDDLAARQQVLLDELAELDRMRSDAAALFDRVAEGLVRQSARLRSGDSAGAGPTVPAAATDDVEADHEPEPLAGEPVVDGPVVGEAVVDEPLGGEAVVDEAEVDEAVAEAVESADEPLAGTADAASPIRVSKGRRRRRADGLPRGDVSVFRVEPTDEIEIVRVVDGDGEATAATNLPETTATGTAGDSTDPPDVVIVSPSIVERDAPTPAVVPETAVEPDPVPEGAPTLDPVPVSDSLAMSDDGSVVDPTEDPAPETVGEREPEPVIDLRGDAAPEPEPEPAAEPEVAVYDGSLVDLTEDPAPEAVGGPEPEPVTDPTGPQPSPPRRPPLLAADDLPVRLSAGGPLDPRPGEYVLGAPDDDAGPAAVPTGTAVLTEPDAAAVDGDVEPTFLDGIFTRLRAERTARTAEAREVLSTLPDEPQAAEVAEDFERVEVAEDSERVEVAAVEPMVEEAEVAGPAVDAGVAALFDRRNELLADHRGELASRLKRVLADQQNVVLDGLHRGRLVDDLGPVVADAFRAAVVDDLAEAATAGSTLVGEPFVVSVEALADELAAELTTPLVRRLHGAVDEGGNAAPRVRSIFREWRAERIAPLAEGFVAAALAQGALAGAAGDAEVRWHCDPAHACAEGADNELAGVLTRGEAFPTGHQGAPAYLGCRCLVVPDTPSD